MKSGLLALNLVVLCSVASLLAQGNGNHLIPTPGTKVMEKGKFVLNKDTIIVPGKSGDTAAVLLKTKLKAMTGLALRVDHAPGRKANIIKLTSFNDVISSGEEGFRLSISPTRVWIIAEYPRGFFYGVNTFLQLLTQEKKKNEWSLRAGSLGFGPPQYKWRSFMLDSGRQYQKPAFIKRYLNLLADLKINVFHWHLTEGQGWRVEIKKYPKLTGIGSWVASGKEQQGFYTQKEIREIVAYAADLQITVVPEIDVPGHAEAALMAYPEYSCSKTKPKAVIGKSTHLFCGGRESTYKFLEDILTEVCDLFPGEYVHIGGDEANKKIWNKCPDCQKRIRAEKLGNSHGLQVYFANRLARFLKAKGRKTICWGDLILHPGPALHEDITIMWWNWRRNEDRVLREALKRGHQVICCTNNYCYLNFPVTPWSRYRADRTFDIRTAYDRNPANVPLAILEKNPQIIGMGCCLWTDWSVLEHMIDRRVFPRIYALVEQMWNGQNLLPFELFYKRVKANLPGLKAKGVNYGPALREEVPGNYKWD